MSKKRQNVIFDPQGHPQSELTTLSYDYKDGHVVPAHFHNEDQLVFASKGVMTIRTNQGIWVVPPLRAVWIPGKIVHSITMSGIVSMRTLYFVPQFIRGLPRTCLVLNISPLLRELILYACQSSKHSMKNVKETHLIEMISDQLKDSNSVPLQLPMPNDPRAKRVASHLIADPSDQRSLEELCLESGGSKRTIERIFQEETKLTFGKWRQQLRLLHSIQKLASGEKVTTVAFDAGYNSTSAFISVFRKSLGITPGQYMGGTINE
jgi:AraC-like DNA-binding protein